jgi:hypothetical protein
VPHAASSLNRPPRAPAQAIHPSKGQVEPIRHRPLRRRRVKRTMIYSRPHPSGRSRPCLSNALLRIRAGSEATRQSPAMGHTAGGARARMRCHQRIGPSIARSSGAATTPRHDGPSTLSSPTFAVRLHQHDHPRIPGVKGEISPPALRGTYPRYGPESGLRLDVRSPTASSLFGRSR